MSDTKERRCKIVYIPHGFIMNFLTFFERECITRPIIKSLPNSGCEVKTVEYFPSRDAFGFIVYHPSFDVVPMGFMCPEVIVEEILFQRIENYKMQRPTIPSRWRRCIERGYDREAIDNSGDKLDS